ncbi:hypothetical protein ACW9HS_20315 [Nocardia gipuzkoensis]|uniref:hypothetical protein n=1 Tax=Nocardia abscessus TaxID=120957 RepID=UPI001893EB4C|nr:hypothetical protein [Nocardia abscessus]MBF6475212.1 hypothetical protein [Nocardia abscessus]
MDAVSGRHQLRAVADGVDVAAQVAAVLFGKIGRVGHDPFGRLTNRRWPRRGNRDMAGHGAGPAQIALRRLLGAGVSEVRDLAGERSGVTDAVVPALVQVLCIGAPPHSLG